MALIHFLTIAVLIHSERAGCQENNIFLGFTPEVKTLPFTPELINHNSFFLLLLNSKESLLQKDKKRVFVGVGEASWGRHRGGGMWKRPQQHPVITYRGGQACSCAGP